MVSAQRLVHQTPNSRRLTQARVSTPAQPRPANRSRGVPCGVRVGFVDGVTRRLTLVPTSPKFVKSPAGRPLVVGALNPRQPTPRQCHLEQQNHFLIISHNHHISATTNGIRNNRPTRRPPARRAGHRVPEALTVDTVTAPRSARHSQPSGNTWSPPDLTSLASTTSEAMIHAHYLGGGTRTGECSCVRATTPLVFAGVLTDLGGVLAKVIRAARAHAAPHATWWPHAPRHNQTVLHDWSCSPALPGAAAARIVGAVSPRSFNARWTLAGSTRLCHTVFGAVISSPNLDPHYLTGVWVEW